MRKSLIYSINAEFREKLFHWLQQFTPICFLNSNRSSNPHSETDLLVAVGLAEEIFFSKDHFEQLKKFHSYKKDWLFGFLSYDLKNEIENLSSNNSDELDFPLMHFFCPKYVFKINSNQVEVLYLPELSKDAEINEMIDKINDHTITKRSTSKISIKNKVSKEEYISTIQKLKQHIQRGDIYEINFCQEFYANNAEIYPAEVYLKLNTISSAPFSAFYRLDEKYILCSSPERFIKKIENKIISQPIKGTRKRGVSIEEDEQLKKELYLSEKEKSENVMIVDIVRNDLSRSAKRGTVNVEELFGIYTFPQVHHMISTVSSELKEEVHFIDAIKHAFPMGSMTGAPKIRAMELIEQYEKTKRGVYSGAIGYITPDGDFDLNVVIRSILYNEKEKYLSFMTGGAITANSDPEQEYEECMIKAQAMLKALDN